MITCSKNAHVRAGMLFQKLGFFLGRNHYEVPSPSPIMERKIPRPLFHETHELI